MNTKITKKDVIDSFKNGAKEMKSDFELGLTSAAYMTFGVILFPMIEGAKNTFNTMTERADEFYTTLGF